MPQKTDYAGKPEFSFVRPESKIHEAAADGAARVR